MRQVAVRTQQPASCSSSSCGSAPIPAMIRGTPFSATSLRASLLRAAWWASIPMPSSCTRASALLLFILCSHSRTCTTSSSTDFRPPRFGFFPPLPDGDAAPGSSSSDWAAAESSSAASTAAAQSAASTISERSISALTGGGGATAGAVPVALGLAAGGLVHRGSPACFFAAKSGFS